MFSSKLPRYWFVIPAAGIGARMNANKPKQYLLLADKTILEHTLQRILTMPNLSGIVVAISKEDVYWKSLSVSQNPLVHIVNGGEERAHSVLNGLDYLANKIAADDWVLVHDAARPCVTISNVKKLCDELAENDVGGILAIPVSDTLKQVVNKNEIQTTIDRRPLWQAQTPQAFRYKLLRDCLTQTLERNENITDESSAVELCGYVPRVVEGRTDNIKITRPDDLLLAEFILKQQEKNL
jgi:2-C-methyl-D-erythritol 4-phosphate cytidylyltransferase